MLSEQGFMDLHWEFLLPLSRRMCSFCLIFYGDVGPRSVGFKSSVSCYDECDVCQDKIHLDKMHLGWIHA